MGVRARIVNYRERVELLVSKNSEVERKKEKYSFSIVENASVADLCISPITSESNDTNCQLVW